jgi:hypothetical protein
MRHLFQMLKKKFKVNSPNPRDAQDFISACNKVATLFLSRLELFAWALIFFLKDRNAHA